MSTLIFWMLIISALPIVFGGGQEVIEDCNRTRRQKAKEEELRRKGWLK